MGPARGHIERFDLGALVLACGLRIERIGFLKPGSREAEIQVNGVWSRGLKVKTIEHVFFISLVVHHLEFRRIEKAPGVQAIRGDEVSPLRASVRKVKAPRSG